MSAELEPWEFRAAIKRKESFSFDWCDSAKAAEAFVAEWMYGEPHSIECTKQDWGFVVKVSPPM